MIESSQAEANEVCVVDDDPSVAQIDTLSARV